MNKRSEYNKRNGNSQADLFLVGMKSIEERRAGREGKGGRWKGATRFHIGIIVGIRESEFEIKKEFVRRTPLISE